MALPTVSELKAYCRVETTAEDALFTLWLARATALVEAYIGRPITAASGVHNVPVTRDSVTGRYVRLYSSGNTSDELNHYCEVEVFGDPPATKPTRAATSQ